MQSNSIALGKFEFDCKIDGNRENDLVIFLHGFPETNMMWKNLLPAIASEGYFCVAPNQRGYSINACPKGKKHYRIEHLVNDVLRLADHFKKDKFHLVGHDWGAIVGWNVVGHDSNRVLSWTSLSVPHLKAFAKAYKIDEDQRNKSSYIKLLMLPFLPEMKIRKNDFKSFRRLWRDSDEETIEDYLRVFRHKKCLTAAINYYRANFGRYKTAPIGVIETPTLFIWGKHEKYIGETAADLCKDYMDGDFTYQKVDGGHWLAQTNHKELKKELVIHLKNNTSNN